MCLQFHPRNQKIYEEKIEVADSAAFIEPNDDCDIETEDNDSDAELMSRLSMNLITTWRRHRGYCINRALNLLEEKNI